MLQTYILCYNNNWPKSSIYMYNGTPQPLTYSSNKMLWLGCFTHYMFWSNYFIFRWVRTCMFIMWEVNMQTSISILGLSKRCINNKIRHRRKTSVGSLSWLLLWIHIHHYEFPVVCLVDKNKAYTHHFEFL